MAAPHIRVADTIGAGDACSAWRRPRDDGRSGMAELTAVRDATAFACVVAARTCERAGASPPRLAEVGAALPG